MKIIAFDSANTAAIHREAVLLLAPLAEKYGVKITAAGGSMDSAAATLKFNFRAESEEAEKLAFQKDGLLFNCTGGEYGRVATINGVEVTLIGFDFKRRKFPVRVRTKDGKVTLYQEAVLQKYFHVAPIGGLAPASTVVPNLQNAR